MCSSDLLRSSIHMQSDQMPDRLSIVGEGLTLKSEMRDQSATMTHGELHIRVKPIDDKPSNDLEFALRVQGLSSDVMPGVAIVAALLVWEHSIVKPNDMSRLTTAFFTINGYISTLVFTATAASLFL